MASILGYWSWEPTILRIRWLSIPTNENWNNYRLQWNKVTALKWQSVKDFCSEAAPIFTKVSPGLFRKTWSCFYQIANPVTVRVQSTCLRTAVSLLTPLQFSMIISRHLQLTSPYWPYLWMTLTVTPVFSKFRRRHLSLISEARVSDILSKLNIRKSAGPDGIWPQLLKIATPVIVAPLTKLFNHCIDARRVALSVET